jgi:hypothetical protein
MRRLASILARVARWAATLSTGELRAIVSIVELQEQVAGFDGLVIHDRDRVDKTRHLRRKRRDLAPDIGIIG